MGPFSTSSIAVAVRLVLNSSANFATVSKRLSDPYRHRLEHQVWQEKVSGVSVSDAFRIERAPPPTRPDIIRAKDKRTPPVMMCPSS